MWKKVDYKSRRICDIFIASFAVALLLVVFLAIAILIKLEDRRSPVLYCQQRRGKNGKSFRMFKFRTMIPGSDREGPRKPSHSSDSRLTRIGRLLRKSGLDELPQLWNVLRGEMSVVGPRPIIPNSGHYTEEDIMAIARCLPGIIGMGQVMGKLRGCVEAHDRKSIDLDIEYVCKENFFTYWWVIYLTLRSYPQLVEVNK